MLHPGLYEQVINNTLNSELLEVPEVRKSTAPIDAAEASKVLAQYLTDVVQKGLENVQDNGGGIEAQIQLANEIVSTIQTTTHEPNFALLGVDQRAEQLLALLRDNDPRLAAGKSAKEMVRPETSIAQSSLFTGAIHEPQMYTELKKEIVSADRIDMLVSFIKWSGLRLIMQILEHGQAQERTLLFFPCTAEPVWAFADTITLLSQRWHVFQVVYDGHQPEYPGDFTSVEQTVDEVISYLKSHGISRLGGAYGCSMGGACLTRMLALGEMPIDQAIIDGGITPYQLPFLVRKLLLARDVLSFKMAANSRKVLEAAFPPERFTPAGHDPKKEYDAMEAYLKTFSNRTIRNVFWSANNYALPKRSAKIGAKITYWYGDDEKKDRRRDIRFIKRYFPKARIHGIPKMAHAELVMVHPEKFCRYAEKFLTMQAEER